MSEHAKLDKVLYTANSTAIGGRDGRVKSDDGALDAALVTPKGLGGSGAPGTNPEQLFAAGYAACFANAVAHVARLEKVKTGTVSVDAKVDIGPVGQAFGLAVALTVNVPDVPRDEAQRLVDIAHKVCPYSNATRGNIAVDIQLGGFDGR